MTTTTPSSSSAVSKKTVESSPPLANRKQRPSPPVSWPRGGSAAGGASAAGEMTDPEAEIVMSSEFDQERARIESWLDEHPDFFQDYLIRKGGRAMIDAWLLAHAVPITTMTTSSQEDATEISTESSRKKSSSASMTGAGSHSSSGSGTPVRKISAHEFEKGGLTKPLVTTIDGTPTFLSPLPSADMSGQIRKRSRTDIQGLNETDLIFELVKDICNDLDVRRLCHKILQNVGILTNADRWVFSL